jgi:hypothetical protein
MTFQPLSQEENISGVLLPPAREEVKKKEVKKKKEEEKKKTFGPKQKDDKDKKEKDDKDKIDDKDNKEKDDKDDMKPKEDDEPIPKDVYVEILPPGNENATTQNPFLKGKPGKIQVRFFVPLGTEKEGEAPNSFRTEVVAEDIQDQFDAAGKRFANQEEFDKAFDAAFEKSLKKLFAFLDDPPKSARDNKTPLYKKSDMKLQIVVPPELRYGYFIQVQDTARGARYDGVGFAKPTRPKK